MPARAGLEPALTALMTDFCIVYVAVLVQSLPRDVNFAYIKHILNVGFEALIHRHTISY